MKYYILWGLFGSVGQILQAFTLSQMLNFQNSLQFKIRFSIGSSMLGLVRLLLRYWNLGEWQWIVNLNLIVVIVIVLRMSESVVWKKLLAVSLVIAASIVSEVLADASFPATRSFLFPLAEGAEIYEFWLLTHYVILLRILVFVWNRYFLLGGIYGKVQWILGPTAVNLYLGIAGIYANFSENYWKNVYYDALLIPMILPLVSICLVINRQAKKEQIEQELEETEHQLALEKAYYQSIEKKREETARFRHDFNNQLMAARRMLQDGEEKAGKEMIDQLKKSIFVE